MIPFTAGVARPPQPQATIFCGSTKVQWRAAQQSKSSWGGYEAEHLQRHQQQTTTGTNAEHAETGSFLKTKNDRIVELWFCTGKICIISGQKVTEPKVSWCLQPLSTFPFALSRLFRMWNVNCFQRFSDTPLGFLSHSAEHVWCESTRTEVGGTCCYWSCQKKLFFWATVRQMFAVTCAKGQSDAINRNWTKSCCMLGSVDCWDSVWCSLTFHIINRFTSPQDYTNWTFPEVPCNPKPASNAADTNAFLMFLRLY